ncbi:MAG: dTDP-4-dehydrorhamnose reductase [Anaerolineae bacterium]|nr:dTDP-4-dehydrorhamnose reductase [Anaerolineae bacterium]
MHILITGAKGRLGSLLVERELARGHRVTGIDRDELDVTDFAATRAFITQHGPDIVLHAAAWTDVDACAREPERALVVNGYGTQHVALAAAEVGAPVLYVSTNEVFDGQSGRPYYEYDTPSPINAYAASKWAGEQAVVRHAPRHYIVRTSWLFAQGGRNFLHSILGAAAAGKHLRVVTDEVANPTYTNDLADAIVALAESGRFGTYHLVNQGACSRYDLARFALDRAGYSAVSIQPIRSNEWPRPSTPPPCTPLVNSAGPLVGITLRPWQEAVQAFLAREGLLK